MPETPIGLNPWGEQHNAWHNEQQAGINAAQADADAAQAAAAAAQTTANNAIPMSQKGVAGGVATLGGDGIVPSSQLPPQADPQPKIALDVREHYGAVGDGVTDDTTAFSNWAAALRAADPQEFMGWIPPGLYRITAPIDFTQASTPKPVTIVGSGSRQTYIIGDFVGPGQGIIDISNPAPGPYTAGHHIRGIGFLGRGTAGDPIGLKALYAQEHIIDDIDAPAPGSHGVPTWSGSNGVALANSVVICSNDNNSKWFNIRSQGGWQPKTFEINGTVSFTSGSNVVTSSAGEFTAAMNGKTMIFASGSDTGSNAIWSATFTYVSAATGTLSINAPSTASGVDFAVGFITGSTTVDSNTLTITSPIVGLDPAKYVGMQIHVLGASLKTDMDGKGNQTGTGSLDDVNGSPGVLSTWITAVSGNTITLAAPATWAVTDAIVLFCPALFVGGFQGDPTNRQNNHSWWVNAHMEGFACAGIITNRTLYTDFKNLKIHGAPYSSPDWAQCYYPAVFSEVKSQYCDGVQAAYGVVNEKIPVYASRGLLKMKDVEVANLYKDKSAFILANVTDEFRLDLEDLFITYPMTNFDMKTWKPVNTTRPYCVVSSGPTFIRSKDREYTKTPPYVASGFTSQNHSVSLANTGARYNFVPEGEFGILIISGNSAAMGGMFWWRKNQAANAVAQVSNAGAFEAITAQTDLTGSEGTADRVQIAMSTTNQLQIQNRRTSGFNPSVFAFTVISFGTA